MLQFVADEVDDEHLLLVLLIVLPLIFIDELEHLDSDILDDMRLQDTLIKTVDDEDEVEQDEMGVTPHIVLLLIENDELEVYDFVQTYLEPINVSLDEDEHDDEVGDDVDVIDDEIDEVEHDDEEALQLVEVEDDEPHVVAEINDEAERDDYLLLDTHVLADILYHEVTANIYVVDTVSTVS